MDSKTLIRKMEKKMKKIFITFLLLLIASSANAADTVSLGNPVELSEECVKYTITWTDDGGDGIAATDIVFSSKYFGFYIYSATTNPGATAPTDDYDIVIRKKTNEADVFQTALNDRDTASTEITWPASGYDVLDDVLQLIITNNSQAGATGTIDIYLQK